MQNRHYRIVGAIAILAVLLTFWLHNLELAKLSQAPMPSTKTGKSSNSSYSKNVSTNGVSLSEPSVSLPSIKVSASERGKELCGVGFFIAIPENADEIERAINEATQAAWRQWKDSLLSSDDIGARAVGLYLSVDSNIDINPRSKEDALEELVQLATSSRNAAAYGVAYQACFKASDHISKEVCKPINASQWAEIDANNATPWLIVATKLEDGGHIAEANSALQHAGSATRIDTYDNIVLSKASWLTPNDIPPLSQYLLQFTLFAVQGGWYRPYSQIDRYCIKEQSHLASNVTEKVCKNLGELLSTNKSLIDLSFSKSLGKHIGWTQSRIDQITDQLAAMNAVSASLTPISMDCKSIEKQKSYFTLRAELGERGAAQLMIDHSGKSVDELAAQYRDTKNKQ